MFNPLALGAEVRGIYKFKAILVHIASYRTAKATQRNTVSKKNSNNQLCHPELRGNSMRRYSSCMTWLLSFYD